MTAPAEGASADLAAGLALRRSAAANATKLGLALGATLALSLLMKSYMPRALGAEAMGRFYFAESFPAMFFAVMPFGIMTYLQKSDPEATRDVMYSVLVFEAGAFVLIMAVMLWVLTGLGYTGDAVTLVALMGAFSGANTVLRSVMRPLFLALERVSLVATLDVGAKTVQAGGVMLAVWATRDLRVVAATFLAVDVASAAVLVVLAARGGFLAPRFNRRRLARVLTSSVPFFLMSIFMMFANNIDQTLVSRLVNDAEVGLYGAAGRLKGIFLMAVPILSSGLFPVMTRTYRERPEAYLPLARDILRTVLVVSFPLMIAMMVFADVAVAILYGDRFAVAARISCWLAPVLELTYLNVFLATHLSLTTRGYLLSGVVLAAGLANVAANLWLIPFGVARWGVGGGGQGAALAALLSELVCAAGLLCFARERLVDRRLVGLFAASLAPCAVLIGGYDLLAAVPVLARVAGFLLLVPLYGALTRMLTVRELGSVVRLLRGKAAPEAAP